MSYQVIARKWRPQTFDEVIGQGHVTRTLKNAILQNRLAHAYIFSGVRGVGKTTTARILAKAVNCVNGPNISPCGQCPSCREIAAGNAVDVLEIDAASNRGIDQIRELRENVRYLPARDRYKVFILDEAHQLTEDAFNALLKTLEEPPPHVLFILATTKPDNLPRTIQSRCQHFHFRALAYGEILELMADIAGKEKIPIAPGALAVIARSAEGSMRDGLSLLDQAIAYCAGEVTEAEVRQLLGVVEEEVLDQLIEATRSQSNEAALELVDRLVREGQNLEHFVREAIRHVRNLLLVKVCGSESELIQAPPDGRPRLAEQAESFSEEDLARFFQLLMRTHYDLRGSPEPQLHLELALLRMVQSGRLKSLEEALAELRGEPARTASAKAPSSGREPDAGEPGRGKASATPTGPPASLKSAPAIEAGRAAGQEAVSAVPVMSGGAAAAAPAPAPIPEAALAPLYGGEGFGTAAALDRASPVKEIQRLAYSRSKFLGAILEQARRWEMDAGELRLFYAKEKHALAQMLQGREHVETLRQIAGQVLGEPQRICVRLEAGERAGVNPLQGELAARVEQNPVVRIMLKSFGGRISEVTENHDPTEE